MKKFLLLVAVMFIMSGCNAKLDEETKELLDENESIQEVVKEDIIQDESGTQISEEKYAEIHGEIVDIFKESGKSALAIMEDGTNNPELFNDEDWVDSLGITFSPLYLAESLLEKMSEEGKVPDSMKEAHEYTLEAFGGFNKGGKVILNSIEDGSFNSQILNEGVDMMSSSVGTMETAIELRDN